MSNVTDDNLFTVSRVSHGLRWILIVVGIILLVVGTCGNVFVIATVALQKISRNLHTVFIIHLAVADILNLFLVLPVFLSSLINGHAKFFTPLSCVLSGFLTTCIGSAGLLTLMMISINRYLNIRHSQFYTQIFTPNKVALQCCGVWVMSALLTSPPLFGWGSYGFDRKTHNCIYRRTASLSYTIFLIGLNLFGPGGIICMCNLGIFKYVQKSKSRFIAKSRKVKTGDITLNQSLFLIFLAYLILLSPYTIVTIFDFHDSLPSDVYMVCGYLAITNSSVNFILYGLLNKNFREAYKKWLCIRQTEVEPLQVNIIEVSSGSGNNNRNNVNNHKSVTTNS